MENDVDENDIDDDDLLLLMKKITSLRFSRCQKLNSRVFALGFPFPMKNKYQSGRFAPKANILEIFSG